MKLLISRPKMMERSKRARAKISDISILKASFGIFKKGIRKNVYTALSISSCLSAYRLILIHLGILCIIDVFVFDTSNMVFDCLYPWILSDGPISYRE